VGTSSDERVQGHGIWLGGGGTLLRLALLCAFGSTVAAGLPSPGLYLALACGIAAVGMGWTAFARHGSSGHARLAAAAAITVGTIGSLLGTVRVVLVLAAIARLERMLP
jgi:hypothetical protein